MIYCVIVERGEFIMDKSKMKDSLKELKSVATDLKNIANNTEKEDNELIVIDEQYTFEHSLINFEEPVDEFNMRNIYPAFPTNSLYIPFPPDNGQFIDCSHFNGKQFCKSHKN